VRLAKNLVALAIAFASSPASAQYTDGVIKIGVLTDMSGIFSESNGPGSVAAARMAVADFGAAGKGMKVEIVVADHQNKPDIGAGIAGSWFDREKVDVIVEGGSSAVALAVAETARLKNKVAIFASAGTSDLTGSKCTPNTIHWTHDTWVLANSTGKALVQTGGDTLYFLTADYAFGHALERDATAAIESSGGKVLGKVRHPINTNDFSSFLLQAQASKAKVVVLASAGNDTVNAVKQASEFGIVRGGQSLASLLILVSEVASLGLPVAQGMALTETWYWDMNDNNRSWTKRWQIERPGKFPTMLQAGVYSSTIHYLKAVEALRSDADGSAVVAKMKEMPTDDPLFGKGTVRRDGRKLHDAYLFEVKKPEESKYPGDFYHLRATIPAAEAFRPLKDGGCPLVSG
jgi:branched-chain amino acid transport system substrate-binding protein